MAGKVEGARDSRNKEAGMSRQRKIFQILMMTTVILLSGEIPQGQMRQRPAGRIWIRRNRQTKGSCRI